MTPQLRVGQRVRVTFPDSDRESRTGVVENVPPWTETVAGSTIEYTDKVEVRYPGSMSGSSLFGDIRETISLDNVEVL